MAQRALTLPIRTLSRSTSRPTQWVCSRCLATHAMRNNAPSHPIPPPKSEQDIQSLLEKPLTHNIPIQYLQHSTSEALSGEEKLQREKASAHKPIVGVVVSSGLMHKTVKVRVPGKAWNKKIGKYFARPTQHLVHDPNNSLVTGDVIELHRLRASKAVHHVVAKILTPFGTPISQRPPIPSPDERLAAYKEYRFAKLHRRELRQKAADGDAAAIAELEAMNLDPGKNAKPGVRRNEGLEKGTGKVRTPKKGAILGEKGQKLPESVLPGGKHEVGGINERAQQNKGKAMKMNQQADRNLLEANEKDEALREEGIEADSLVSTQGSNVRIEDKPQ